MAKNFLFKNATVFQDKNSRSGYSWAIAELFYEEDEYENPNTLPSYPILHNDVVKKFGKCSTLDADRTNRAGGNRKFFTFDLDKAYEAIVNKKFTDGTPCCRKHMVNSELTEFPDDFVHISNVEAFDCKLTGTWGRIALKETEVKFSNGTTKNHMLISEDSSGQIEMLDVAKTPIRIVDEAQTGYDDPRWIEKSNSIKARDNYTCQLCHAFNPMQEYFVFVKQGDYETMHRYREGSIYEIIVKDYGLPISFAFSYGYHLVMPRLNVHHKIYYKNRDLWDYPDDCLVTLCENCHHYIHSLNDVGIPIVEENREGKTFLVGKTQPKPYLPKLDHTDLGTFQPFALVKENVWGLGLTGQNLADFRRAKDENKQWYDYYETLDDNVVKISCLVCKDPLLNEHINEHSDEEIKRVVEFITYDFLENFLGFSKIRN